MQATVDACWDSIVNIVSGLALTVPPNYDVQPNTPGGTPIPVVKRKLVRAERQGGLDATCLITVFRPEQPEKIKYYSFRGPSYTFRFIIAVMYPGNQNNTANVGIYAQHRDAIAKAFETFTTYPVLGVAGTYDMRVEPDVWLPRSLVALGYDYQALGLAVSFTR